MRDSVLGIIEDGNQEEGVYASQDSIYCGASSANCRDLEKDRLDCMQATYFDVAVLQVCSQYTLSCS